MTFLPELNGPVLQLLQWFKSLAVSYPRWSAQGKHISSESTNLCDIDSYNSRNPISFTKAFMILDKWLCPSNEDARFWWYTTGAHLSLLLQHAGYEDQDQYAGILFLRYCVVGRLGPRPTSSGTPQIWKSFMTDDFSPIEYSWSWDTGVNPPKIRFSIEAIGLEAGTRADFFNQKASKELVQHVDSVVPNIDWSLFHHFSGEFCSQESKGRLNHKNANAEEVHTSSIFLAFEMRGTGVAVKAYFIPVRAEQMGESRRSVLTQSIRNLEGLGYKMPSYDRVLNFMTDHPAGSQLEVIGIAIDCVTPSKSRMKVYVRSPQTSFDSVCTILSLGGDLDTFSDTALIELRELWRLTLCLDESFPSGSDLNPRDHQTAGVLYNFDIKPGNDWPQPKVYIPVKHYAPDDLAVAEGLAAYLTSKGRDRFVDAYRQALEGICSHRSLDSQSGVQTYISCAVQNEELVLTSYFGPEIHHYTRW